MKRVTFWSKPPFMVVVFRVGGAILLSMAITQSFPASLMNATLGMLLLWDSPLVRLAWELERNLEL